MWLVRKDLVVCGLDGKGLLENVFGTQEAAKQLEGWMETVLCVYVWHIKEQGACAIYEGKCGEQRFSK